MKSLRYFSLFVFMASFLPLAGQESTPLYYMSGVPQKTLMNPAFRPESRGFMGNPGFSMLHVSAGNTGFGFNNIISLNDTGFTLDVDGMLESMPSVSRLYASAYYQPIAFGFSLLRKGYFTFSMAPVMSAEFFYPRDLFGLVWKGNGHEDYLGKRITFDGTGIEASLTNEISIGYSHMVTDNLTLGFRGRHISGLMNVHTEKFNAGITTDADDFGMSIDLDAKIHASIPLVSYDSLTDFDASRWSTTELINEGLDYLNKNRGYAFDFGATYMLYNRFFFSASVNNLGSINWSGNPVSLQSKGSFEFNGIDVTGMIKGDTTNEFSAEEFLDSIADIFKVDTLFSPYKQVLPPSVNLGVAFFLSKDDAVGFLWRNQFYHGIWYPKMTLSYNHRFGRILSISATYDLERGSYKNIGAGVALKLGPMQYYLITDNALAFAFPLDARQISVMTGVNWLFGSKPKKESVPSI